MDSFTLKMIAIITMLIDHMAVVLVPSDSSLYFLMRCIGRLAFPIFCFLIVEGHSRTKNVGKYMIRLGIFAFISEIPFDLMISGSNLNLNYQNVFFTLFMGLITIHIIDIIKKTYENSKIILGILSLAAIYAGCFAAEFIHCDYGSLGIILILAFYLFKNNRKACVVAVSIILIVVATVFYHQNIEGLGAISLIFILLYNGSRGFNAKYIFYVFYPVHMLILYAAGLFIR